MKRTYTVQMELVFDDVPAGTSETAMCHELKSHIESALGQALGHGFVTDVKVSGSHPPQSVAEYRAQLPPHKR